MKNNENEVVHITKDNFEKMINKIQDLNDKIASLESVVLYLNSQIERYNREFVDK